MQAIFFDANGVLYDRVDKHGPMRAFLERHHLPAPSAKIVHQATAAVRQRAFVGTISKAAYYEAVLAAWGVTDPRLRDEGHRVQDAAISDKRYSRRSPCLVVPFTTWAACSV